MAKFCEKCGKGLHDEDAFCPGCGTKVASDASSHIAQAEAPEQQKNDEPTLLDGDTVLVDVVDNSEEYGEDQSIDAPSASEEPAPQPTPLHPVVAVEAPTHTATPPSAPPLASAAEPSCKVAGVGAFLGFEFLFSIPFIGWILCIIMAFAPKNKNLKNFARARLIWILIGILLFIVSAVILWILGNIIVTYLENAILTWLAGINWLPDTITTLNELMDIMTEIMSEIGYY